MKNHNTPYFSEKHYIKNRVESLSGERLLFLDGRRLGDVELREHDAATGRKLRRIIEKRVAQDFWASASRSKKRGNGARFETRHRLSNQVRNLFGPDAFRIRECA